MNADNWIYADGSNSKKAVNLRAGTNLINDIKLTTPSASSDLHIETAEEAWQLAQQRLAAAGKTDYTITLMKHAPVTLPVWER